MEWKCKYLTIAPFMNPFFLLVGGPVVGPLPIRYLLPMLWIDDKLSLYSRKIPLSYFTKNTVVRNSKIYVNIG